MKQAATIKNSILQKIRQVLKKNNKEVAPPFEEAIPENVYTKSKEDLAVIFAEALKKVSGNFIFCENLEEFIEQLTELSDQKDWKNLHCWHPDLQEVFAAVDFRKCRIGKNLDKADAGITTCEALIARTGSILLSSALPSGRNLSIYPPVHICVAYTNQFVYDIKDAFVLLNKRYENELPSFISLATGPSRTADIEKTLVLGAHGPKELYVFLIEPPLNQ